MEKVEDEIPTFCKNKNESSPVPNIVNLYYETILTFITIAKNDNSNTST